LNDTRFSFIDPVSTWSRCVLRRVVVAAVASDA